MLAQLISCGRVGLPCRLTQIYRCPLSCSLFWLSAKFRQLHSGVFEGSEGAFDTRQRSSCQMKRSAWKSGHDFLTVPDGSLKSTWIILDYCIHTHTHAQTPTHPPTHPHTLAKLIINKNILLSIISSREN